MLRLIVLAVFVIICSAEHTRYDGYQVYQVTPETNFQVQLLKSFEIDDDFDFWSRIRITGKPIDIMVAPASQFSFKTILNEHNIKYKVLIEDVERVFQEERARQEKAPKVEKGRISFSTYHRYEVIQDYIYQLAQDYPNIVSVEDVTNTTENRKLTFVKIGTGGPDKPGIVIDGAIHAREWISPSVVLYVIQQLVENPENAEMIENVNWYIFPVLNPDGYEFSHTNNRLWRKTRRIGNVCNGVDGNRNFDYHWSGLGSSSSECSEIYHGPFAFSEPETRALAAIAERYGSNIKLYVAVHSFGQYILYPWGWTSDLPENALELHQLGDLVNDAISAVNGTNYVVGSSTYLLGNAAGCSDDWMKGPGGVDLSYTLELPGGGQYGFDLPASRIVPVVEETWPGFQVYYNYIVNKFGPSV